MTVIRNELYSTVGSRGWKAVVESNEWVLKGTAELWAIYLPLYLDEKLKISVSRGTAAAIAD
jgi:hypothetical protein